MPMQARTRTTLAMAGVLTAALACLVAPGAEPPPSSPAAGQGWTVPDLGLELVSVAPGSFQMGSSETRAIEKPSEKPVHMVTLSKGFWLGKYEAIQTEYEALTSANPSGFRGPRRPVEQTSWSDAVAFRTELTERERAAGRLPAGYEYRPGRKLVRGFRNGRRKAEIAGATGPIEMAGLSGGGRQAGSALHL
jgi:formylglycine-generating enzyme required for sulfatase activity